MSESSAEKLAFRTHRGLWQFRRMPFGLCLFGNRASGIVTGAAHELKPSPLSRNPFGRRIRRTRNTALDRDRDQCGLWSHFRGFRELRVRVAVPVAPLHVAAIAPATPPTTPSTHVAAPARSVAPITPPTTPSTQHISAPVPGSSRAQPIDLSADDASEAVHSAPKRKFLGVVKVFDEEEEEVEPPMKTPKFLGIVDLTN
ncbi:hypothetical protein B0H12DRAFT_1242159 [Mycena haematopus]|nr:hypothetical protein B0H12DRAFT_1242159 [Mycena haematopus]